MAVPLLLTAIVSIVIVATGQPLGITVPAIGIVAMGALGGLWARRQLR